MNYVAETAAGMKAFLEEASGEAQRVDLYLGHQSRLTGLVEVREDVLAVFPAEGVPPYIVPISTIVWARYVS